MEKLQVQKAFNKLNIYDKLDFLESNMYIITEERIVENMINYFERRHKDYEEWAKDMYNKGDIVNYKTYATMCFNVKSMLDFLKNWGLK